MKILALFAPSRSCRFYALAAVFLICVAPAGSSLFADTLTGQVRGNVFDVESHAPLLGVSITLLNLDQGWKRQLQTDADGNFVFMQLDPGHYSVAAEFTGYYRAERSDILIRLNQLQVVVPPIELRKLISSPNTRQITLRGEQTKTVIVDITAPGPNPVILAFLSEPGFTSLLSLLDWGLRFNFEDALIQALPLRGVRSFDQLALLSPGVFRVPFSTGQGPAVGIGVGTTGQFSVNGLRGRSNNFTVDGSDNNDEDIGVRRQGFVSLVPQSIESVQEFQIMTAGFPAEFGRNSASMVNAVSRSGKKDLHGSAYAMFNDDHLNARNFFEQRFNDQVNAGSLNGGSFRGKNFTQLQAGGTLGAALVPNKVFYFLSAEHQKYHGTAMAHFVVPAAGERGLRVNPIVDDYSGFVPINELATFLKPPGGFRDVRQSSGIPYSTLAGKAVLALYPLPNNPTGPFGLNNYSQARSTEATGDASSAKIDWRIAERLSFAARYNFTNDHSLIPFTSDAINSSLGTSTRTQNISLFLNSAAPRFGNAFRFSYGRTRLRFPADKGDSLLFGSAPVLTGNADIDRKFQRQVLTPYGRFGPFGSSGPVGQLSILPYSTIGIDVFNFPQARVDNTFQISDFITQNGPAHTIKFGADIRRSQLNSYSDRNSRPLLIFGYGQVSDTCLGNPLCIFATPDGLLRGLDLATLGAAAGVLQTISTSNPADTTIGLRFTQYDLFIQDDWKLGKNLTANFGLRYEYQTVPMEANRRIEKTFGLAPAQFRHLQPAGNEINRRIIEGGNRAFDRALQSLNTLIAGRKRIYQRDRNNFAPRVGFSWDPFGKGTTAIRAGYSLSYDATLGAITSQSRNVAPNLVPVNFDPIFRPPDGQVINSPVFFSFIPTGDFLIAAGSLNTLNAPPEAFATFLGAIFNQTFQNEISNSFAFTLPDKNLQTGYAQHFVLSLERQLARDMVVSVDYIGTRGAHLTRFTTPNGGMISSPTIRVLIPSQQSPVVLLSIADIPPSRARRIETGLGAYTIIENSASSGYHSLQLSSEKRFARGLQFRGHWTWSHALDEVSDPFDGRGFYSLPQNGARLDLERASANFDARHRVAGYFLWEIPGARAALLRSWKLAGTMEFQTGQPFTVNTAIDRNGDGNLTDRLNSVQGLILRPGSAHPIRLESGVSTLDLIAPPKQDGKVSRNSFRAAGIATIDASLSRRFAWRDRATLDFRAEAFNLFNRTHFGIPVRILESPAFGRAFDTQVNPRSVRLTLKVTF